MKRHIVFKIVRKIFSKNKYTDSYVELSGQSANDYIYESINSAFSKKRGLMISKFGTVELDNLCCYLANERGLKLKDYISAVQGQFTIYKDDALEMLCRNAGFFPSDFNKWDQYCQLVLEDSQEIDILASYVSSENMVPGIISAKKVNLEGYYAPFLWENPWTSVLKNKKILVIHPFVKSIKNNMKIGNTYSKMLMFFQNLRNLC